MKQQKISEAFPQGKTGYTSSKNLSKKRVTGSQPRNEALITFKEDEDDTLFKTQKQIPLPPRMGTRSKSRAAAK